MHSRLRFWPRRVAALLILLVAVAVAIVAALLTPYFLQRTASIAVLVILAFLLDRPDAIPPYPGDADPR